MQPEYSVYRSLGFSNRIGAKWRSGAICRRPISPKAARTAHTNYWIVPLPHAPQEHGGRMRQFPHLSRITLAARG